MAHDPMQQRLRTLNLIRLSADNAVQMGDWVLGMRGRYAGSTHGVLPAQEVIKLGGFLKLSGFANEQLSGDQVSYAHIRGERILGRMPLGLRGDLRAGIAFEAGRIRRPLSEPNLTGRLDSIALYLGGETPVGPVYIGLGRSSTGQSNAYFFLGTP
jgi:NTE family protein